MLVIDFPSWKRELLETGRIVQDQDQSVAADVAEHRFNRYIELVSALRGSEGTETALALVQSIQVPHDYGAYEGTLNALLLFPAEQSATAIVAELPRLIGSLPEWAGDLLSSITRAGELAQELVRAFNAALKSTSVAHRKQIVEFIREEEADGWLEGKGGALGGVGL